MSLLNVSNTIREKLFEGYRYSDILSRRKVNSKKNMYTREKCFSDSSKLERDSLFFFSTRVTCKQLQHRNPPSLIDRD